MSNPFDQFDDAKPSANPFDQFDSEAAQDKPVQLAAAPAAAPEIAKVPKPIGNMARGSHPSKRMEPAEAFAKAAQDADDAVRMVAKGMVFGYDEEAAAAAKAALGGLKFDGTNFVQRYDDNLKDEIAHNEQTSQRMGTAASTAAQVAGGLAGGIAMPGFRGATAASSLAKTAAVGAGKGGAVGAVSGAASGAGDAQPGFVNRAKGAAVGAAINGPIGLIVGGAAPAATKVGGALIRTIAPASVNAETTAVDKILAAFRADGVPFEKAQKSLESWIADGSKPAALFDLGGENVRKLARATYTVPGKGAAMGRELVDTRIQGQQSRVLDDVKQFVSPNTDFYGAEDDIVKSMRTNAKPLYDEAYNVGPVWSDKLEALLHRPSVREAYNRARTIAQNEGGYLPELKFDANGKLTSDLNVMTVDRDGVSKSGYGLGMNVWDYLKRGIDDVIQPSRNQITGKIETEAGRAVDSARRQLVDELDNLNPAYKKARAKFESDASVKDALQAGRSFAKEDADLLARDISKFSEAEKEAFRIGVARDLVDRIKATPDGADNVKRILRSTKHREQLKAAFANDGDYVNFMRRMDRETKLYENAQFIKGGSQTENKRNEVDSLSDVPQVIDKGVDFVTSMADGRIGDAFMPAVKAGLNKIGQRAAGWNNDVVDVVSKHLFNTNPEEIRKVMLMLAGKEAERHAKRTANGLSRATTGAGSVFIAP